MSDYRNEEKKKIYEKIEIQSALLPDFVRTYISASIIALQPSTIYQYIHDLKLFFDYMSEHSAAIDTGSVKDITLKNFANISHEEMDGFVIWFKKTHSDNALLRILASVSALYSYYIKLHRLNYNPVSSVRKPRTQKDEINRLKGNEKDKLLSAVQYGTGMSKVQQEIHKKLEKRDYAIIRLFLFTGIRVSELVGLDLSDVDFDTHSIIVTRKGGKSESVFFDDDTENALKEYMEERVLNKNVTDDIQALFISRKTNDRMSVRAVEHMVKKYSDICIPQHEKMSPHRLRATFASDFYVASKGDLLLTAKKMGHKSLQSTSIYADATKQRESDSRNLLN